MNKLLHALFAVISAALTIYPGMSIASASTNQPLALVEIAPGTFVHHGSQQVWHPDNGGDIANLSFIVGERCVAVIDTGSTLAIGLQLKAAIKTKTRKPVCYVVNTHAHPDHMLGNAAFKGDGAKFVGHKNMAAAVATRGPIYLRAVKRDIGNKAIGTELIGPDISVSGQLSLDIGGKTLLVKAWPTSHTDADVTIFDQQSKTLWLGDLSFVGHLPVVDGNLKGWLKTMESLADIPAIQAVPGHGTFEKAAWPDLLKAQSAYLTGLRDDVRKAIADGLTLSKALETVKTGAGGAWLVYDEFHKRNVSAAYAELEWE